MFDEQFYISSLKKFIVCWIASSFLLSLAGAQTPVDGIGTKDKVLLKHFYYLDYWRDSVVTMVWDEYTAVPVKRYVVERSRDGSHFEPVSSTLIHSRHIPDVHKEGMHGVPLFNHIFFSTECGHGRFLYNELSEISIEDTVWYRIRMDTEGGAVLYTRTMNTFERYSERFRQTDRRPELSRARNCQVETPDDTTKGALRQVKTPDDTLVGNKRVAVPIAGEMLSDGWLLKTLTCPSVESPPSGYSPTGNVQNNSNACCTWTDEEYYGIGYGSICDYFCCSEEANCTLFGGADPCCCGSTVCHTCTQYLSCSCRPWPCCQEEWIWVTTSVTDNHSSLFISKNDESCPGASDGSATANVSGGTSPYNYSWGGQTISGLSAGTYCVTVTNANNCTVTGCITINTLSNLTVSASSNSSDCSPCNGSASASPSSGLSPYAYSWSNGGSTSNITGLCPGSYTITVTDAAGCTAVSTVTVGTVSSPTVSTSSTASSCSTCDGTATANPSGGTSPFAYSWSNGGPTSIITGLCAGSYTVTITDAAGCTAVSTTTVTVFPTPPNADFTATSVCFGTSTQFTDLSTITTGSITGWSWDFGDGNNDTVQNPSYLYTVAGTYNVTLTVTSDIGCTNTVTYTVDVYDMPLANFTATDVCLNQTTVFTDISTITIGAITQWQWDFGDGVGTSTLQDPTYVFSTTDTFIVTLTITSDNGCTAIVGYTVVVFPLPVANFTTANVCLYDDAVFTDISTVSSGSVTSWQWDFGDGNTASTQNTTHLYSTDSAYNVTLIVTTNNNCTDTMIQPLVIYPVPSAGFTTGPVCLYDAAVFTDLTTINSPGSVVSWDWDFGDGTSTTQNPTHLYSTDGTYNVSLTATSGNGCVNTVVQSLIIYPVPAASFTTGNVCLYDAAVFTDLTTINAPDNVVSWDWDFGDGIGTSTNQNPTYNYGSDGLYNVQLTVTSNNNCINSTQLTITIYPLPVMNFISDTFRGCEPLCVNFSDLTTITSGTISSWDWDFGDGSTSDEKNPQNCYTAIDVNTTRISTVTLIVRSSDGCLDTLPMIDMITTWPNPIAGFMAEPQPTTILAPVISFTDQSIGDTISWSWDFGDGFTETIQNPVHEYLDTGTYIVEQIIVNQFSCPDTFYRTIIIQPDYIFHVPSAFTPNDDGINETFIPQGIGIDEDNFEMYIYDRWGDLIYETNDINKPWDGRANNGRKIAQQDVYIWVIFTRDMQGTRHKYLGRVTLIR